MQDFDLFLERVGKTVRELRLQNQWSQEDLAQRTGRPQPTIGRLETSTHNDARLSVLYSLAKSLNVSLAELIGVAEGKSGKANKSKTKLESKWEKISNQVEAMDESDRQWIATILEAVLKDPRRRE